MHSLILDVLQTLRSLRRSPTTSVAILLTLMLGIGGTTVMFSVVQGVLLNPLPFPEPDRLFRLGESAATAAHVAALHDLDAVTAVTALGDDSMILDHEGTAVELRGLVVDGHHHEVFGVVPLIGRGLEPADSRPGSAPVVLLSHSTWTRFFDADPEILGQSVPLSGQGQPSHTVIGVHDVDYRPGPWRADFLTPHRYREGTHDWQDMARFRAIARTRGPVTSQALQAEARALIAQDAANGGAFNQETANDFEVTGLLDARVGSTRLLIWMLFSVVGAVLLIGSANVANLVVVRGIARSDEFSLRKALGAGRARLARQLITEGLTLSLFGGLLGTAFAVVTLPWILDALPRELPRSHEIGIDAGVLLFSLATAVLVGVAFGLVPLARAARGPITSAPRGGTQGIASRRANELLIAAQIALCLVLLSSGGQLARSLAQIQKVDPGLEIQGLRSYRLSPPADRLPEDQRAAYFHQVEQALAAVPGVDLVGSITNLPLTPAGVGVGISPDGDPTPPGQRPMGVSYRAITPGYLSTARIPLLSGRNITEADRSGAAAVGLVNQRLAKQLWPDRDPVGQTVSWSTGDPWFTVVGVIGDVHQKDLATESQAEAYVPYAQEAWLPGMHVLAKTSGNVSPELLRTAVRSVDPMVPISSEQAMTEVLAESLSTAQFNAVFFGAFALLGLVLSAVGIYGITLHSIAQRRSELGVRMALGADAWSLVGQVVRGNTVPVAFGLAVGLLLSWASASLLRNLLFGAQGDIRVFLLAFATLGTGTLLISAMAARGLTRLRPSRILRASR